MAVHILMKDVGEQIEHYVCRRKTSANMQFLKRRNDGEKYVGEYI